MPRKRQGAGGNRTDLLSRPQPVATPTGLPYGEAQQLQESQQAQPLAGVVDPQAALQAATAMQLPPPIHTPTDRPNEPLTTGLPTGPGAGPEILNGGAPDPTVNTLQGLYSRFPTVAIQGLLREAQRRSSGG